MVVTSKYDPLLLYKVTPQILPFAAVVEPLATVQNGLLDLMVAGLKRLFQKVTAVDLTAPVLPDSPIGSVNTSSSLMHRECFYDVSIFPVSFLSSHLYSSLSLFPSGCCFSSILVFFLIFGSCEYSS